MNKKIIKYLPKVGSTPFCVLIYFMLEKDKNNEVICSLTQLQKITGLARDTVIKAIKILKDYELIQIFPGDCLMSNIYKVLIGE